MLDAVFRHALFRDFLHIDIRADFRENAFHMRQSPCQHGKSMRHGDLVFLHGVHDIHEKFRNIDSQNICLRIPLQNLTEILVQLLPVRFPPAEIRQRENRIFDSCHITAGNTLHGFLQKPPVPICQPPHHSHINPDNFAPANPEIARMRICMEKAVLDDLFDKIIYQLFPDFIQIIAVLFQRLFIHDRIAVYVLHNKNMRGGVLPVKAGNAHESDIAVIAGKFLHVVRFLEKVHLLLRHFPEFIQNLVQIHNIFQSSDRRNQTGCLMKKPDVPCHQFPDSPPLNLDDNLFPGHQPGTVNLRHRSRTKGRLLYAGKNSRPVVPVGFADD